MSNGNEPAYPGCIAVGPADDQYESTWPGLTKREAFAMAALTGILANPGCTAKNVTDITDDVARHALLFADSLLAALGSKP